MTPADKAAAKLSDIMLETLALMVEQEAVFLAASRIRNEGSMVRLYSVRMMVSVPEGALPFPVDAKLLANMQKRGLVEPVDRQAWEAEVLHPRATALGRAKDKPAGYVHWGNTPYPVSALGHEVLQKMEGRLVDIRQARLRAEETPRFVAVKRGRPGYGAQEQGVGNLYRIVRETEGRVYVAPLEDTPEHRRSIGMDMSVSGHGSNRYVERERVIATDITPEQYRALVAATEDYLASSKRAAAQMEAEMAPIRRRHAERQEQLLAQLEDEMREAIQPSPAFKP